MGLEIKTTWMMRRTNMLTSFLETVAWVEVELSENVV
jgi:hypothetical protein